jgi:molybdate transport system substrate-binding protein
LKRLEIYTNCHAFGVRTNGATAMHAMAQSDASRPIGCTQITEIKSAERQLVASAAEFELSTVYSAGRMRRASQPELARHFVRSLSGSQNAGVRSDAGFDA